MSQMQLGPDSGTRCLVIGGCGGIGRAYVEGLVAGGARVAVLDLAASFASIPLPADVLSVPVDVRDEAALTQAIETIGTEWAGLDVFTYVTGINGNTDPVERLSMTKARDILNVNLVAAIVATQAAMPFLRKSAAGVILFVSSGLSVHGEPTFGPYAASKGGLNALMKVLAREGAPTIRANVVAPGLVDTAFLTGGTGNGGVTGGVSGFLASHGEAGSQIMATIPLGRVAVAADIAGPMLFMSGPASRFMTGQIVHVNGGRYTP
jgi:NAD(P)-dependent dehydrogenase (short-subunit alcohol dehydrogenase family)